MGSRFNETIFKEAGKEKSLSDSDMYLIQTLIFNLADSYSEILFS